MFWKYRLEESEVAMVMAGSFGSSWQFTLAADLGGEVAVRPDITELDSWENTEVMAVEVGWTVMGLAMGGCLIATALVTLSEDPLLM